MEPEKLLNKTKKYSEHNSLLSAFSSEVAVAWSLSSLPPRYSHPSKPSLVFAALLVHLSLARTKSRKALMVLLLFNQA